MKILYTPSGRAGEYADKGLACNLFRGCTHGCRYCYAPAVMHMSRADFHKDVTPVKDVLARLEADCREVHPEPIFLSFTTDVCCDSRLQQEYTIPAVDIIKRSGNRVRILTKGHPMSELMDLLGPEDEFGVTLTCVFGLASIIWEPFAALPGERLSHLIDAQSRGIQTWASFEPVICPMSTLALIMTAAPYLGVAKIGTTNHLERINWPSDAWRRRLIERIDWARFAREASELCESRGLRYVLKVDLRAHLSSELSDIAATPLLPEVA